MTVKVKIAPIPFSLMKPVSICQKKRLINKFLPPTPGNSNFSNFTSNRDTVKYFIHDGFKSLPDWYLCSICANLRWGNLFLLSHFFQISI